MRDARFGAIAHDLFGYFWPGDDDDAAYRLRDGLDTGVAGVALDDFRVGVHLVHLVAPVAHPTIDAIGGAIPTARDTRYREALFPTLVFRQAWEQLQQWHSPRKADLIYLRLLRLAARTMECEVEAVLKRLLLAHRRWDDRDVEPWLALPPTTVVPTLAPPVIDLNRYDQLLTEVSDVAA